MSEWKTVTPNERLAAQLVGIRLMEAESALLARLNSRPLRRNWLGIARRMTPQEHLEMDAEWREHTKALRVLEKQFMAEELAKLP
jgi:hypothetical protein